MNFSDFILAHEGEDLARLALSRERVSGEVADFDLALTTLEVRRKLRDKVPEWYAETALEFPLRISGEQCSSTATARYKASLVPGRRIADLTGGLGVDTWAFAQVFDQVLYNEMRPELAAAAARNFTTLGLTNVTVRNYALVSGDTLGPDGPRYDKIPGDGPRYDKIPDDGPRYDKIPDAGPRYDEGGVIPSEASVSQILCDFNPDVLFLDPARRAADGRKVFRLEDCQPDVLQLLPELLTACPKLLLKLSPMADITLVCRQLGCVKEVHVVAAEGECKELLLVLEKDWDGPYTLTVYEDGAVMVVPEGDTLGPAGPRYDKIPGDGPRYDKYPGDGPRYDSSESCHTERSERISGYLFEPGHGLLKAGAFGLPCQLGLSKLGRHTHLYTGEEIPAELKPFGKCFKIIEVAPLDKRHIKAFGQKYPKADVTARNIPLTSDQLRAKLGVRSGSETHIFGLHSDALQSNLLIIAQRA